MVGMGGNDVCWMCCDGWKKCLCSKLLLAGERKKELMKLVGGDRGGTGNVPAGADYVCCVFRWETHGREEDVLLSTQGSAFGNEIDL